MANIMRMNGQGMNKKAIYLFKNGSFVQQPSSNTFRVSNGNLTNGDNTTSCKWNNLNDKIKIYFHCRKFMITEIIISFSSGRDSAIIKVMATKALSLITLLLLL